MDASGAATPISSAPGLRGAFKLLVDHLGSHMELLQLELGSEIGRLGGVMGYWVGLTLTLQLALSLGFWLLLAYVWDTAYRVPAMIGCAVMVSLLVAFCVWQIKRLGQRSQSRFQLSAEQWRRDMALLREVL